MARTTNCTVEYRTFTTEDAEHFKALTRAYKHRNNPEDISSEEFFCDEMDALAREAKELYFITPTHEEAPRLIVGSIDALPGAKMDTEKSVLHLPVGYAKLTNIDHKGTFVLGNASLDLRELRITKKKGITLGNLNFFKGTGTETITFTGLFRGCVIKTDTPLNTAKYYECVIDSTGSDFSPIFQMESVLIYGTLRARGNFELWRAGFVGDIAIDSKAGDIDPVCTRNGFIVSEGVDWVETATKATGDPNPEPWTWDMWELLRARDEKGVGFESTRFCVTPTRHDETCKCGTWLSFREGVGSIRDFPFYDWYVSKHTVDEEHRLMEDDADKLIEDYYKHVIKSCPTD